LRADPVKECCIHQTLQRGGKQTKKRKKTEETPEQCSLKGANPTGPNTNRKMPCGREELVGREGGNPPESTGTII